MLEEGTLIGPWGGCVCVGGLGGGMFPLVCKKSCVINEKWMSNVWINEVFVELARVGT